MAVPVSSAAMETVSRPFIRTVRSPVSTRWRQPLTQTAVRSIRSTVANTIPLLRHVKEGIKGKIDATAQMTSI